VIAVRRGLRRAIGQGRLAAAVKGRRPPVDERSADPADVQLVRAGPDQRDVLANLIQLYRHDLSEIRGFELSDQGTYAYHHLDDYLSDPEREAYLVRVEGRLAGLATIHRLPDGVWQISEFFVARPYRRRGVGRIALRKTFETHSGRWTCFVDELNDTSLRMCASVVEEAGEGSRAHAGVNRTGFVGTVLRFAMPERTAVEAPAAEEASSCCGPAPAEPAAEAPPTGPVSCC